ncbi:hypothetical protein N7491_000033 [Penicillium cf. griseofulvum]|uniref:Uncharacterized protein n=1 Tax=Penicillium cf. griseofulvum TaxID=2972120 RepID=A0A9W9JT69_9EURO|nr:hypothetical protein N7472_004615 [Penicillium cf. griseofulvum]KAJ5450851.1 hypothetical protein N7491_000033 [Penicillium cf. griseofulvum]
MNIVMNKVKLMKMIDARLNLLEAAFVDRPVLKTVHERLLVFLEAKSSDPVGFYHAAKGPDMVWWDFLEEGSVDAGVLYKMIPFGQFGPKIAVAILEDNIGV